MPPRIAQLPRDARGYPIPWNVLRGNDGAPIFTVNDDRRAWQALRQELCPICGERLGKWRWFVGGPRSAFDEHGWYLDLPGHQECMQFALATCPYLAAPKYLGRIDVPNPAKLPAEVDVLLDETMLSDRPEFFVAVAAARMELNPRPLPELQPYVRPARPAFAYEFWRHGVQVPAHRVMPILRGMFGAEWTIPEVVAE